jgi:hypothetical protein
MVSLNPLTFSWNREKREKSDVPGSPEYAIRRWGLRA